MQTNCASVVIFLLLVSLVIAKIPRTDVTVSGFSSGGAMATQLHFALSNDISGCGVLAGPPYYCGGNGMTMAICLNGPASFISVSAMQTALNSNALYRNIDSLSNIRNDPVYAFSGKYDTVVLPGIATLNEQLYTRFGANVKTNFNMLAHHGFPTDNFGGKCDELNKPNFINNCNFNLAYDMLNHLYGGNLLKPDRNSQTSLTGNMFLFDQVGFMNTPLSLITSQNPSSIKSQWIEKNMILYSLRNGEQPTLNLFNLTIANASEIRTTMARSSLSGFDKQGFVYFPSACIRGQKCSIHVALHGCQMGKSYIGDVFVTKAGYLEVAELNNIIVIFPQILASTAFPINAMGCWDFWGYSSIYYATRSGPQISGIKKMIDTVRMINTAFVGVH
ncbi:unnamed protein product [Adineta steineri]|uniref:Polyhydroxybutyrate depolymerase n=2 Tax=Adineta steineri TaxID=433720 RepID=A0A814V9Q0_9BILA|nr:unnamed protein product [Adineta steineri]CAF4105016.1 unnamed protein product [Adineta steineri]